MWYKVNKIRVGTKIVRPVVWEFSYDFRNKTTTQVTNDWWFTYRDTRSWSVDSNGLHIVWFPWCLWKYIDNSHFQNAKKITVKAHVNIQTYSNNAFISKYDSWETLTCWWNIDTRQSFRKINFNWTEISQTNASIPYWQYDVKMVFDFVNKTATLSLSWFTDVTVSLTDSAITNVKNNVNFIGLRFYNDSTSNTASYYRDIHILVE